MPKESKRSLLLRFPVPTVAAFTRTQFKINTVSRLRNHLKIVAVSVGSVYTESFSSENESRDGPSDRNADFAPK